MPHLKYIFYLILFALLFINCNTEKKDTLFNLKDSSYTNIDFNNIIIENDTANILTEEYIFNGGGIAAGDFNNDGKTDLFFTGNQVSNRLYLNQGALKFKDISKISQVFNDGIWSTSATTVDINSDGLLDIYVCLARESDLDKRANLLYINQGNDKNNVPIFKESAAALGIDEKGNSMGAAFFDYDKDGLLDLYVLNNEQVHVLPTNYRKKVTDGSAVSNDKLYHNNGDGTFTDVTIEAGILYEGFGLGLAIADLNYDGWPDIYVSNDYLTNDLLYLNNGDGTFSNKIEDYIKHQSKFSMGNDISDFNNDGLLDIVTLDMLGETNYRMKTTNMGHNYISYVLNDRWDYEYQYSRNMLQLGNSSDIPFSEIGMLAGVSKTDWSWSPLFVDVNNDSYKDLLITNGFPRDITDMDFAEFRLSVSQYLSPEKILDSIPTIKISNYAYKNQGDLTFKNVAELWGLDTPSFSNGAIFSDLDNDGDLDYVVNNINDNAFVFENTLEKRKEKVNYLKIKLNGNKGNILGIGSKIKLTYGENSMQYYEHHLTRGYMSSVDPLIHFGLGDINQITTLTIEWPDGQKQRINNLNVNQTVELYQKNASNNINEEHSNSNENLLAEFSESLKVTYLHKEKDIVDYNLQSIIPHKLSQNGPCLASGDLNGDNLEDFIIGSSSTYSPMLFFQSQDGSFNPKELFADKESKTFEEESILLFDLENDGDLDIYMVSGSNEFPINSKYYNDRILLNDGKGNFTKTTNRMPLINTSGSVARATDFDNDGYVDVFIGGRTPYGQYPVAENSYLLKNINGTLMDVTDEIAPSLNNIGMVTDAIWEDIDNDTDKDLIIIGEFMEISFFVNEKTSFRKLKDSGLDNYYGLWESIESGDFDNDGDIDFIVGNVGSNNFYQPSKDRPIELIAKDFDNNGSIDPILFAYFKNKDGNFSSYPVNFWGDLSKQSTIFRSKFNFYKDFGMATKDQLLTNSEIENSIRLKANFDKTCYIENLGNQKFKITPLPTQAQLAPINDIIVDDINLDGHLDVILVGNDYGNETFIGRYDAFNGLILIGEGTGKFNPINSRDSGFKVVGDAKALEKIKNKQNESLYIASQNRGNLLIFKKK